MTPAGVLALQRTLGNAGVAALLQRCGHGRCTCGGTCGTRQDEEAALVMTLPGDATELEADRLARRALGDQRPAGQALQRTASDTVPVPSRVGETLSRRSGTGVQLDTETRTRMEQGFGADFAHVRIFRDAQAADLARAVDAEAFTVGSDIFFNAGRFSPGTELGDRLLAHELAHVVQAGSTLNRRTLFRQLTPALCASGSGCAAPDVAGSGTATKWSLTIAVDREEEGLGRLQSGNVGHTWVKLDDDAGEHWSYGMWPQRGFNASRPWQSVPGCIHHPDTAHEPPLATQYLDIKYDLTRPNYDKALAFADAECKRQPDYNLFSYNCTTFAIKVAKEAGVTPPASSTLAVHNPNALFEGIEEETKKRAAAGSGSGAGKKSGPPAPAPTPP